MRSYLALAALAVFAASPAFAEMTHYKANLTGAAETPPNDSKGTGKVDATYDSGANMLKWTIDYSGLTGPASAAHFHRPAPAGNAPRSDVPLTGSPARPTQRAA